MALELGLRYPQQLVYVADVVILRGFEDLLTGS